MLLLVTWKKWADSSLLKHQSAAIFRRWCHLVPQSLLQRSPVLPLLADPKGSSHQSPPHTPSRFLFIASNTLLEPNQANNEDLDVHQCIKYYIKCQTRYLWGEEKLTWCACFEFFFFLGLADAVCLSGETGSALQPAIRWRLFFGFSFSELWCLPTK